MSEDTKRQQEIDAQKAEMEKKRSELAKVTEELRASKDRAKREEKSLDALISIDGRIDMGNSLTNSMLTHLDLIGRSLMDINGRMIDFLSIKPADATATPDADLNMLSALRDISDKMTSLLGIFREDTKSKRNLAAKERLGKAEAASESKIPKIGNYLKEGAHLLTSSFGFLAELFSALVMGLFTAAVLLFNNFWGTDAQKAILGPIEDFLRAITYGMDAMAVVFKSFGSVVSGIFKGTGTFSKIGKVLTGTLGGIFKGLGGIFKLIGNFFAPIRIVLMAFDFLWAAIPQFNKTLEETGSMPRAIFDAIIAGLANIAKSLFDGFVQLFAWLLEAVGFKDAGDWIKKVGDQFSSFVFSFFENFSSKLVALWGVIGSAFDASWQAVESLGAQMGSIIDAVVGGIRDAILWLQGMAVDAAFWMSENDKKKAKDDLRRMLGAGNQVKAISAKPTQTGSMERGSQAITAQRTGGGNTNVVVAPKNSTTSVNTTVNTLGRMPVAAPYTRPDLGAGGGGMAL